jgi:predicted branched-subunit amino acid permease
MTSSRILKWITGGLEVFLGIPVLGGLIIIGTFYTPLVVMLILHIITLVLSAKNNELKYGSILGIVTSLVAWIPIVGMILHIITGILLMVTAAKKENTQQPLNA